MPHAEPTRPDASAPAASGSGALRRFDPRELSRRYPYLQPSGPYAHLAPIPLHKPITLVGSRKTARIHLNSKSVSRAHALLIVTPTGLFVHDLQSRVGTQVNGEPVREMDLHDGDELTVANFTFVVGEPRDLPVAARPPRFAPTVLRLSKPGGATDTADLVARVTLIGRRSGSDVHLPFGDVSTANTALVRLEGFAGESDAPGHVGYAVYDLGGKGTVINGRPVHKAPFNPGDTLVIGATKIRLAPAPPISAKPAFVAKAAPAAPRAGDSVDALSLDEDLTDLGGEPADVLAGSGMLAAVDEPEPFADTAALDAVARRHVPAAEPSHDADEVDDAGFGEPLAAWPEPEERDASKARARGWRRPLPDEDQDAPVAAEDLLDDEFELDAAEDDEVTAEVPEVAPPEEAEAEVIAEADLTVPDLDEPATEPLPLEDVVVAADEPQAIEPRDDAVAEAAHAAADELVSRALSAEPTPETAVEVDLSQTQFDDVDDDAAGSFEPVLDLAIEAPDDAEPASPAATEAPEPKAPRRKGNRRRRIPADAGAEATAPIEAATRPDEAESPEAALEEELEVVEWTQPTPESALDLADLDGDDDAGPAAVVTGSDLPDDSEFARAVDGLGGSLADELLDADAIGLPMDEATESAKVEDFADDADVATADADGGSDERSDEPFAEPLGDRPIRDGSDAAAWDAGEEWNTQHAAFLGNVNALDVGEETDDLGDDAEAWGEPASAVEADEPVGSDLAASASVADDAGPDEPPAETQPLTPHEPSEPTPASWSSRERTPARPAPTPGRRNRPRTVAFGGEAPTEIPEFEEAEAAPAGGPFSSAPVGHEPAGVGGGLDPSSVMPPASGLFGATDAFSLQSGRDVTEIPEFDEGAFDALAGLEAVSDPSPLDPSPKTSPEPAAPAGSSDDDIGAFLRTVRRGIDADDEPDVAAPASNGHANGHANGRSYGNGRANGRANGNGHHAPPVPPPAEVGSGFDELAAIEALEGLAPSADVPMRPAQPPRPKRGAPARTRPPVPGIIGPTGDDRPAPARAGRRSHWLVPLLFGLAIVFILAAIVAVYTLFPPQGRVSVGLRYDVPRTMLEGDGWTREREAQSQRLADAETRKAALVVLNTTDPTIESGFLRDATAYDRVARESEWTGSNLDVLRIGRVSRDQEGDKDRLMAVATAMFAAAEGRRAAAQRLDEDIRTLTGQITARREADQSVGEGIAEASSALSATAPYDAGKADALQDRIAAADAKWNEADRAAAGLRRRLDDLSLGVAGDDPALAALRSQLADVERQIRALRDTPAARDAGESAAQLASEVQPAGEKTTGRNSLATSLQALRQTADGSEASDAAEAFAAALTRLIDESLPAGRRSAAEADLADHRYESLRAARFATAVADDNDAAALAAEVALRQREVRAAAGADARRAEPARETSLAMALRIAQDRYSMRRDALLDRVEREPAVASARTDAQAGRRALEAGIRDDRDALARAAETLATSVNRTDTTPALRAAAADAARLGRSLVRDSAARTATLEAAWRDDDGDVWAGLIGDGATVAAARSTARRRALPNSRRGRQTCGGKSTNARPNFAAKARPRRPSCGRT